MIDSLIAYNITKLSRKVPAFCKLFRNTLVTNGPKTKFQLKFLIGWGQQKHTYLVVVLRPHLIGFNRYPDQTDIRYQGIS